MEPDQLERIVNQNTKAIRILSFVFILFMICFLAQMNNYYLFDKLKYMSTKTYSKFVTQPVNNTIVLTKQDVALLNYNYRIFSNEFAVCFTLQLSDGVMVFRPVKTFNSDFNNELVEVLCSQSSDMVIHSHPNGVCKFSDADIQSFVNSSSRYDGIICGVNDFVIVDRYSTKQKIMVI